MSVSDWSSDVCSSDLTTDSNGEKNKPNKKKIPVVIAVIPERPPTAIPADDSTNAPTDRKSVV